MFSDCYIITLTAREMNRQNHRTFGWADDYVAETFSPRGLVARTRRCCAGHAPSMPKTPTVKRATRSLSGTNPSSARTRAVEEI